MAGQVVPILTKRTVDMGNLGATASDTQVLVKTVPVSMFTEGQLLVRVHSGSIGGSGKFEIVARPTQPSFEEPSVDFLASSVATATVTATHATNSPTLVTADLGSNFGANLQIRLIGTRDSGDLNAELSIDMVLKD